jgi:hypothetical protein
MLPRRNLASQPVRRTSTPGRRVRAAENGTGHGDSAPSRPEKWRKSGFPGPTNGLVTQVTGGCASSKSALCLRHAEPGLTSLGPVSSFLSRFPPWGIMHRITARLLLVFLLVGTFTPFAAAVSMQASHPHCARKLLPAAPMETMPGCRHHTASPVHRHAATETAPVDQVSDFSQCCCDHECCRSMARSQWAQVSLREQTRATEPAAVLIAERRASVRSFDLSLYRSVRAPPVL